MARRILRVTSNGYHVEEDDTATMVYMEPSTRDTIRLTETPLHTREDGRKKRYATSHRPAHFADPSERDGGIGTSERRSGGTRASLPRRSLGCS
ncbi:hypothetical protein Trydic_g19259 [Trypoxylus dichotomus]